MNLSLKEPLIKSGLNQRFLNSVSPLALKSIAAKELDAIQKRGKKIALIDVVSPSSYEGVHIEGAVIIPLESLQPENVMNLRGETKGEPLYLICHAGVRSKKACERFMAAGFPNVVNIEGGKFGWKQAGLPLIYGKKRLINERALRIGSGTVILLGSSIAYFVHPAFIVVPFLAGGWLLFSGFANG